MIKQYLLKYYEKINDYNGRDYIYALIKLNLAPTIEKLKIGTMINLNNGVRMAKKIWEINKVFYLENILLSHIELRNTKNSVLVLFYNYEMLEEKLKDKEIKDYLVNFGYGDCQVVEEYLAHLKKRFEILLSCPDEVGIFLGYPLEDVKDFHCSNTNCKLTGYWRCYNNQKEAQKIFKRYDLAKIKIIKEELVA